MPLVLALDVNAAFLPVEAQPEEPVFGDAVPVGFWEENSHSALRERLQHLTPERKEMFQRLWKYPRVFGQALGLTTWAVHDIDVGDATPVKLPPYQVNPVRQKALEEEIKYMLDHDLIKRGPSEWSSPVLLQPKPNG